MCTTKTVCTIPIRKAEQSPTPQEVEALQASGHVQYRSWCRHCVSKDDETIPLVSCDYAYRSDHDSLDAMPIPVIRDCFLKAYASSAISKTGVDQYAV